LEISNAMQDENLLNLENAIMNLLNLINIEKQNRSLS